MFIVYLPCFQNPVPSYTFRFCLICSVSGTVSLLLSLPHLPSPLVPDSHFQKSYPQSKAFLNIRALPRSAVFYINAVLMLTPSYIQFFSFFDVLPSAPSTTGMVLMLLMFQILLISLFSFWYVSIVHLLFFANSYVFRYSNINYGTTFLILVHYNNNLVSLP